mmetsp:Transcript_8887/g.36715  ORF Transcript_8887/g.36715 Transcript_8887/m.36715 type:complete len:289 (-) Transcript_8887:2-868(-)
MCTISMCQKKRDPGPFHGAFWVVVTLRREGDARGASQTERGGGEIECDPALALVEGPTDGDANAEGGSEGKGRGDGDVSRAAEEPRVVSSAAFGGGDALVQQQRGRCRGPSEERGGLSRATSGGGGGVEVVRIGGVVVPHRLEPGVRVKVALHVGVREARRIACDDELVAVAVLGDELAEQPRRRVERGRREAVVVVRACRDGIPRARLEGGLGRGDVVAGETEDVGAHPVGDHRRAPPQARVALFVDAAWDVSNAHISSATRAPFPEFSLRPSEIKGASELRYSHAL